MAFLQIAYWGLKLRENFKSVLNLLLAKPLHCSNPRKSFFLRMEKFLSKIPKTQGLCLHFLLRNSLQFVKQQKTQQNKLLDRTNNKTGKTLVKHMGFCLFVFKRYGHEVQNRKWFALNQKENTKPSLTSISRHHKKTGQCTSAIPSPGRPRQETLTFKFILLCVESWRLAWTTWDLHTPPSITVKQNARQGPHSLKANSYASLRKDAFRWILW